MTTKADEENTMAEKNRQEKRGKRAPFNLGARKHWINDSREREKGTFLSTVSTAVTVYPWIRKDTRGSHGRVEETKRGKRRGTRELAGLVTLVKGCLTFFRAGLSRSVHT